MGWILLNIVGLVVFFLVLNALSDDIVFHVMATGQLKTPVDYVVAVWVVYILALALDYWVSNQPYNPGELASLSRDQIVEMCRKEPLRLVTTAGGDIRRLCW